MSQLVDGRVKRSSYRSAQLIRAYRSSPDWLIVALLVAMLCYIWRLQDLFPYLAETGFVLLVSLAAIGLFLVNRDRRRSLIRAFHRITIGVAILFVVMVLSIPGSVYPGYSFDFIVQDFAKTFLLMILLAASARTINDLEWYLSAQVAGAGLYGIFTVWRFEVGGDGRLGDLVYHDANDIGMLIVCTLPLAIYFLRPGVRFQFRFSALVAVLVSLVTIVKTGSRGAFLALVAVLLYMLIHFRAFSKRKRYVILAGMAIFFLAIANETYWESMQTLLSPQDDYNWSGGAEEGRIEVWKRGIGYMIERPLLGVGAAAFPIAEGTVSELSGRQGYGIGLKWSAAHNSFVQIGAELGVTGLLTFSVLLVLALIACHKIGNDKSMIHERSISDRPTAAYTAMGQALCATLIGYLVAGFFLSQAYAAYLYATFGIIVGLIRVTSDNGQNTHDEGSMATRYQSGVSRRVESRDWRDSVP